MNIHFHILFLKGVITEERGQTKFKRAKAPSYSDMDNTYLALPIDDEDSLLPLQAASVNYRIALGPDVGKKVFTLQTLPAKDTDNVGQLAKISGFSLHAGVFADSHQSEKLEHLSRYIARPAISKKRLTLTSAGKVRYKPKTAYNDGTTYVLFEPLDFMGKLAALVPPPRLNLIRFYGFFAQCIDLCRGHRVKTWQEQPQAR